MRAKSRSTLTATRTPPPVRFPSACRKQLDLNRFSVKTSFFSPALAPDLPGGVYCSDGKIEAASKKPVFFAALRSSIGVKAEIIWPRQAIELSTTVPGRKEFSRRGF